MHPAYSVIFFTVLSGAGLGLLFLLSVMILAGHVPGTDLFGASTALIALALIGAGALSSGFHLGRPERAWRAFSQWRSSWLSREGVLMAAVMPFGLALAAGWFGEDRAAPWWRVVAGILVVLCPLTVWVTAMIYASLKPVPRWHNAWTPVAHLLFALMSGAAIAYACLRGFGYVAPPGGYATLVFAVVAVAVKLGYWRHIDRAHPAATAETATGLGAIGKVRPLDPPHTEENYLLKEMGFRIARKHAGKLRRIALIYGFALPAAFVALALAASGWIAALAAILAAVTMLGGLLVERWLFFAEARHTVMLYYGTDAV
ncbi:dimethyl sulfoxide reductase anchor subunit family protein [Desertibaculum subflavum]|uniref:dimethyl sulfoxide reductase anchor subunit family protein n=1 Tax=Desertibaculum subflavum TaxID=2268458 RepID=UPI000E674B0E